MYFDRDPVINFEWFRFIGRARFNLSSDAETMRMTMKSFKKRYQAYKDVFDTENILRASGKTYAYLDRMEQQEEEWF